MRHIRLFALVALSLIALGFKFGQSPKLPQSIELTSKVVDSQSGRKPYLIDLTRKGRTYSVSADVANRVQIRTSKGKMSLTELMEKLGITSRTLLAGGNFRIGTPSDLRVVNFGRPLEAVRAGTGGMSLKCGVFVCTCDPNIEDDCNGTEVVCANLPMVCRICDGPGCSPEQMHKYICSCVKA